MYLGDTNYPNGGLSTWANLTNTVSDGDIGFTNSGVFTIGGQNTSGINTYQNPIQLGLTANRGKGVTLVAAGGGEVDFTGNILANGSDTTAGVTVGDATHNGIVKLTGANTYAGGTTVTNGTLLLSSSGGAGSGAVTVNNGGVLGGSGNIGGNVAVNSGGRTLPSGMLISYGSSTTTLGISGNLTYNSGSAANFNLSDHYYGGDQVDMSYGKVLTASGESVGINLFNSAVDIQNYTLITYYSSNSGAFASVPVWLGYVPPNATNYSIVTTASSVILQYSPISVAASSVTPNPASHGQLVNMSLTVVSGMGAVTNVTVDTSGIGGMAGVSMVLSNGNTYTNSAVVSSSTAAGIHSLTFTIMDNAGDTSYATIPLTVISSVEVWNGGASPDNTWSNGLNWASLTAPGYGDFALFAGTVQTTANMLNSYALGWLAFSNNAGSFNITNSGGGTLTLNGGVTNNSANVETVGVPVVLNGVQTFDAAGGSLVFSNTIADGSPAGGVVAVGNTNIIAGNTSYSGATTVGSGLLQMSGSDTFGGPVNVNGVGMQVSGGSTFNGPVSVNSGQMLMTGSESVNGGLAVYGGTLQIGDPGQLNYGTYTPAVTNNGTILYNSTAVQALQGVISGTGGLTVSAGTLTLGVALTAGADTYTGATVVNGGTLVLNFNNTPTGGLATSSGITINNGGTVNAFGICSLSGTGVGAATEPVTINAGGTLTSIGASAWSGHVGILNLNGGVLADQSASWNQYSGWELDNQVNVNGGTNTSYINDPLCVPYQTGGTVFNITAGSNQTVSGIDLDVAGALVATTGDPVVTGIILKGNGTMRLDGTNDYAGSTTIGNGVTLVLGTSGQLNTGGTLFSGTAGPAPTYTGSYGSAIANNGTFISTTTNAQTLAGIISGTGTLVENSTLGGRLTLAAANTYTGNTVITNGTLQLTNGGSINNSSNIVLSASGIFDVSPLASPALAANQALTGTGTVNAPSGGALGTSVGSSIKPSNEGATAVGTLTVTNFSAVNGGLTLAAGATVGLYLSASHSGVNDRIAVGGALTVSGSSIHIAAPSASAGLDQTADYVLITAGSISGGFASAPVWDVAPTNAAYYTVLTVGNTVVLHYTPVLLTLSGAPNPVTRGKPVTVTVNATSAAASITGVSVNATAIGGSPAVSLALSNGAVWTNTIIVSTGAPVGTNTLYATATDGLGYTNVTAYALVVQVTPEVWNGGASPDNTWVNGTNWAGGVSPLSGDLVTFAGTVQTTPNMMNSYVIGSLAFSNNAGAFNITNNGAGTLNLTGGVTNNSTNVETVSVPVAMSGAQSFNAASNSLVFNGVISGSGGGVTVSGTTNIFTGTNSYPGATTVAGGALIIGGSGLLGGGSYAGAITNNGAFGYNSPASQTLSGVISGTGALKQTGAGTLTLSGSNSFSGGLAVESGTLIATNSANALGGATGTGTVQLGGASATAGATLLGDGRTFANPVTIAAGDTNTLTIGNASPNINTVFGGNITLGNGSLTVVESGGSGELILNGAITGATNSVITILSGGNAFTNTVQFQQEVSLTSNTGGSASDIGFLGGYVIGTNSSLQPIGNMTASNLVTIAAGGLLNLHSASLTVAGVNDVAGSGGFVSFDAGSTVARTLTLGGGGSYSFNGVLKDGSAGSQLSLTVALAGGGRQVLGGTNNYGGPTTINSGTLIIGGAGLLGTNGYAAAITDNGVLAYNSSAAQTLGGAMSGTGTLQVNAPGGVLTLNGADTCAGGTSVSNGTLVVNGSVSNAINIYSGGALAGGGTVNAVTNQSGGNLAPGAATNIVGTVLHLGLNNSLILNAGSVTTMKVQHNGSLNDQVVSGGFVVYNGTLTVITNAGDSAFTNGDRFVLFNFGLRSGSFTSSNLPPLTAGLAWSNNLAGDGSVEVVSSGVVPPPAALFSGTPTNGFAPLRVVFTNLSTGSFTSSAWSFGDGNVATNGTGANVTNTYAAAGTYNVSLIVSGAGGSGTNTQTAYIVAKPKTTLGRPVLAGGQFIFSGTNGPDNGPYRILGSTNVSLALSNWTVLVTNTFRADGSYSYTNTAPTNKASFFILVSP